MRFWVELKDHVPNGQTVTSLLRFNTFNRNKLITNQCPVAKAWQPLQSTSIDLNRRGVYCSMFACDDRMHFFVVVALHGLLKLQTSSRERNSKYFHSIMIFTTCFVVRFKYHPCAVSHPAIFVKRPPSSHIGSMRSRFQLWQLNTIF